MSLDSKILSLALKNKKFTMELVNSVHEKYFAQETQWLFMAIKHFFNDPNIREIPSYAMTKEFVSDRQDADQCLAMFNEISNETVEESEFTWLLEKLRFRYNNTVQIETLDKIKHTLDTHPTSKERVQEVNTMLKESVVAVDSIHRRSTYKEGTLKDSVDERLKWYQHIKENPDAAKGIYTGFSSFDQKTNGLHPGEFMLIAGDTGCQPAGSKVLMSDGKFKNIEDILVGDTVFSPNYDGSMFIATVTETFKFRNQDVYKITSTGRRQKISYRASGNHIIPTIKPFNNKSEYLGNRLVEMTIDDYNARSSNWHGKSRIFTSSGYDLPEVDFPIDPYIVGVMLGDGSLSSHVSITSADKEIFDAFEKNNIKLGKFQSKKNNKSGHRYIIGDDAILFKNIIGEATSHHKKVPEEYFYGSINQRLEILAGLIDTDGTFQEFSSVSKQLAEDFRTLVYSVGGIATIRKRFTSYDGIKKFPSYRVHFSFAEYVPKMRLSRKQIKPRNMLWKNPRHIGFNIQYDCKEDVYGFALDGETQWYITDDFIVTHNTGKSILMHNIGVNAYLGKNDPFSSDNNWDNSGHNILYFSLEMPKESMERRIDSCMAGIYSTHIRDGLLSAGDEMRYFRVLKFQAEYQKHFHIVDMPKGATTREIELKYLEVCESGWKPDLVIVDYLGIMSVNDSTGSDWQDLGVIAAELHEFARVYEIAVITGVQVNRTKDGAEKYDTDRIARSAMIAQNANIAIQIAKRADEYVRTDMPIYITKMRDGEKDQFTLSKDFAKMKVTDIVDESFTDDEVDLI